MICTVQIVHNIKCFNNFYKKNSYRKNYGARVASGLVANCIGISIFFFAILVVYLVVNPRFKRLTKLDQDQELS